MKSIKNIIILLDNVDHISVVETVFEWVTCSRVHDVFSEITRHCPHVLSEVCSAVW